MDKYTFFFPTLDGYYSILRLKLSIDFLHEVLFTVKMGSGFTIFRTTRLSLNTKKPAKI